MTKASITKNVGGNADHICSECGQLKLRSDQLAPHNIGAEEATLGALLSNPEYINLIPRLESEDFFLVRHGWIIEAMYGIRDAGMPIDYLTVANQLKAAGRLEETGGESYLIGLTLKSPSALNVEGYARLVKNSHLRRMLIDHAQVSARLAHSEETAFDDVLEKSQASLNEVMAAYVSGSSPIQMVGDVAADLIEEVCDWRQRGVTKHGMHCGLAPLDNLVRGWRRNKLYIVCGQSGMGKSTLIGRIILGLAWQGYRCLFFALEMSAREITSRMACQISHIAWNDIEDNVLSDADFQRYIDALVQLTKLPIGFCCEPGLTVSEYRTKTQLFEMEKGPVDMIAIDTLNLVRPPKWAVKGREMAAKSNELKQWAQDEKATRAAILSAHQLRKPPDGAAGKRPTTHDVRGESEQINDADGIYAVDRPWEYASDDVKALALSDCPPAEYKDLKNLMYIWQLKARGTGEAGDRTRLYWHGATFSIERREENKKPPSEQEKVAEKAAEKMVQASYIKEGASDDNGASSNGDESDE